MAREPELESLIAKEVWQAFQAELLPRITELEGSMGVMVRSVYAGIEDEIPLFMEAFDQDEEMQARVWERLQEAVGRIKAQMESENGAASST